MAYNLANSLSPMIFKKSKVKTEGGTRNERYRSKSMENIADSDSQSHWLKGRGTKTKDCHSAQPAVKWDELSTLKSLHSNVVLMCVVPSVAMDFVASAVLAVGAVALVTEDPEDVEKDLEVCKAVLLDVSAPRKIVEAVLDKFELGCKPLILVVSDCGTNDRKKDLAMRVINEIGPNFITGKVVDIYTLAMARAEKSNSQVGSSDSEEEADPKTPTLPAPKVVLSMDQDSPPDLSSLPPAVRRRMKLRSGSASPSTSPPLQKSSSATVSPLTSPPDSVTSSPKNSPRSSPRSSPTLKRRGIKKLIYKKRAQSDAAPIKRVPTVIPRLRMKGQFRGTQGHDISHQDAYDSAQNLAAHTDALIHIFESKIVTNGEVIAEMFNSDLGMNHLHSVLPVCGAVVGCVLACVEGPDVEIELKHGVHALALYYVATEEGGASTATVTANGTISAGTLRAKFIDALHHLQPDDVRLKLNSKSHTEGVSIDL